MTSIFIFLKKFSKKFPESSHKFVGFTEEAKAFMEYLHRIASKSCEERCGPNGPLQIMYKIDGSFKIEESELSHLEGYKGSYPGNYLSLLSESGVFFFESWSGVVFGFTPQNDKN